MLSMHSTDGKQAQPAQRGQQPQCGQQAQKAKHAEPASWKVMGATGDTSLENPFKASEQFPICLELCLSLPNSNTQDSQQGCLLTDCTTSWRTFRVTAAKLENASLSPIHSRCGRAPDLRPQ